MTPASALPPISHHPALGALPALWQAQACDLLCSGARGLDTGPALPGRLRGAWGQALLAGASPQSRAGEPCPWSPPCALDGLFRDQGHLTPGLPVGKPWVIEAFPVPEDDRLLAVRLVLFGAAIDLWMPAAAEALTAALRGGIADGQGQRLGLEVIARQGLPLPAPPLPEASPEAVVLRFRAPVVLRQGGQDGFDAVSLLTGLGNRISGLARWMGCAPVADWSGLKAAAQALHVDAGALRPVRWQRWSSRQGGRPIPMAGFMGDLTLGGHLAPLLPLLVLGTQAHAGAHAALGLGAYDLLALS